MRFVAALLLCIVLGCGEERPATYKAGDSVYITQIEQVGKVIYVIGCNQHSYQVRYADKMNVLHDEWFKEWELKSK